VKRLVDAGVNVAFGTDTGPIGRFPGYFEHWEAELMVEAGVKPMRVIEAWSKYSSEALGIDKNFGTLEKGKVADLIVLDANPLDDIRNTRKIHAVYLGGKKFD
jgi:imidazolonepropionase-like amidohydrolase